jgi:bifunctional non-homologous end joining protein LigD
VLLFPAMVRVQARSNQAPNRRQASLPKSIDVQLAVLAKEAPEGDDNLHEAKFDGYRMLARVENGKTQFITRNDINWTHRFPELAHAIRAFSPSDTVFDGEIVSLSNAGISSFSALQEALSGEKTGDLVYYAVDLLFHEGQDLRQLPLEERKKRLAEVLVDAPPTIRLSKHVVGGGPGFFKKACGLKLEGIVSKRRTSTYAGDRNPNWLKVKCVNTEEFIIIGYTDPQRSRVGFGALLVGYYTPEGEIRYAGKVGTGYSREFLESFRCRLDQITQEKPTAALPKGVRVKPHWVKPRYLAQVNFTEWTRDGILRHPSFLGLREDKDPREVIYKPPSGS